MSTKRIAIIGSGASGCVCAYFLSETGYDVTLFDKGLALRTLLPTGGGRCNLAHAEYDIKELAKNYPRGEKFLYSVFSRFCTSDTIELFENMGIKTYVQENGRIFPESNSAKDVREKILKNIKDANFVKEEVVKIELVEGGFKVVTNSASQNKKTNEYFFTHVVIASGGHSGYKLVEDLGIEVVNPKPSLVGLNTENDFKDFSGTVIKGAVCNGLKDDLLFTHFGVSGPLIYTISSFKAFDTMPYTLTIDLSPELTDLQADLNTYPHKEIKNLLNKYLPPKIVNHVLKGFDETTKAHKINGKTRDIILDRIHNFKLTVIGTNKGEETVTAGGVELKEINPKTMQVKKIPNLYCIGELLNIDGLCGGFNLQNAWSTAYVCAESIKNNN